MLLDLRNACRTLAKSPGFLASSVITLALGIGVTTSEFSVLNAVMFRRIPYPHPEQLVHISCYNPKSSGNTASPANLLELGQQTNVFSSVAIGPGGPPSSMAVPGSPPDQVHVGRTNAAFFPMLETPPLLGRYFSADDEHKGNDNVIVLSYPFWMRRFGGNPTVIGQSVHLDGRNVTIVGVMPAGFDNPMIFAHSDCWAPQVMNDPAWVSIRNVSWMAVYGRLRDGVSPAAAQAQLDVLAAHLGKDYPATDAGLRFRVVQMSRERFENQGPTLLIMGFAAVVLLIACANLSGLQLARSLERERELAIRIVLGASRASIIRLLVSEGILIVGFGGLLGLLFACVLNRLVGNSVPISYTEHLSLPVDFRVLCFAVTMMLLSALAIGLAPAVLVVRSGIAGALKQRTAGASGDRTHRRFREFLLAGEIALSMVLLTGAMFFVGGYKKMSHLNLGWQPDNVMVGGYELSWNRYATDEACRPFLEKLETAISGIPGVKSAALASNDPVFGGNSNKVSVDDPGSGHSGDSFFARANNVSPDYLTAAGLELIRGRWVDRTDRKDSAAVAVINESMAKARWTGTDPIGRRFWYFEGDHYSPYEVVGIVRDTRPPLNYSSYVPPEEIYRPLAQHVGHGGQYIIRSSVEPAALEHDLQLTTAKLDPDLAVYDFRTSKLELGLIGENFVMINYGITFYALFGLILVLIGIYSLIARTVYQRTREIGIRMALGAKIGQVVELVAFRGFSLALAGSAIGSVAGLAVTRILSKLFVGFPEVSLLWFISASVGLLVFAWVACLFPARHAARVDPMVALRSE